MPEVYDTLTFTVNPAWTTAAGVRHDFRMAHDFAEKQAFGMRLARARHAATLTLTQVGSYLTHHGWPASKQAVGSWEKGKNLPDPLVLRKLCRLYHVSAESLLWESGTEIPAGTSLLDPGVASRMQQATGDQQRVLRDNVNAVLVMQMNLLQVPEADPSSQPGKQREAA